MPESVENLEIWQEGIELVKAVYALTAEWPKEERFGLITQVRRAAVSIPSNIAEGIGRGSHRETARFAKIALGSLYELDTLLHLARELHYLTEDGQTVWKERLSILARSISAYISYKEERSDSK